MIHRRPSNQLSGRRLLERSATAGGALALGLWPALAGHNPHSLSRPPSVSIRHEPAPLPPGKHEQRGALDEAAAI
jgi:hypothetical protein